MKLEEFKKLNIKEQVNFINKELQEVSNVKNINKETKIQFTWDTIKGIMKENHYNYNAKTKQFEEDRHGLFTTLFSMNDIFDLKEMLEEYKTGKRQDKKQEIDILVHEDNKNRSVRVSEEIWVQWLEFCKENSKYSNTSLMNTALSEFMSKYKKN